MIREGRLGKEINEEVASFVASTDFDINILAFDLFNDMAHVIMLAEREIIGRDEAGKILKGLKEIYDSMDVIKIEGEEDVHVAIEEMLTEKIGDTAGKMHTARSRNDQIACDLRIWLRAEVNNLSSLVMECTSILLEKAAHHVNTLMPGYTHLQKGQPTTLGHHLVAHADAIIRDLSRLEGVYTRINLNPLGAGALATTTFPLDRKRTKQLLGFDGIIENSMDA
ncbi:MAG: lyase family protein, partial [Candidatus Hydrothermarchaeales archaeon]